MLCRVPADITFKDRKISKYFVIGNGLDVFLATKKRKSLL